jgi:hypothetical protein
LSPSIATASLIEKLAMRARASRVSKVKARRRVLFRREDANVCELKGLRVIEMLSLVVAASAAAK